MRQHFATDAFWSLPAQDYFGIQYNAHPFLSSNFALDATDDVIGYRTSFYIHSTHWGLKLFSLFCRPV